jgi:hypothetical protein
MAIPKPFSRDILFPGDSEAALVLSYTDSLAEVSVFPIRSCSQGHPIPPHPMATDMFLPEVSTM